LRDFAVEYLEVLMEAVAGKLRQTNGAGLTFWTIFGTSNQLLAALTLMTLSLCLARSGRRWWVSAIPKGLPQADH